MNKTLLKGLFSKPRLIIGILLQHPSFMYFSQKLPDSLYLRLLFYSRMGKKLHLKEPQTFSEKLQWLKLYDHNPLYTRLVDKYAVKEYVKNIIGSDYIIPTIGVWNSVDEINFDILPNSFVLKCTHDSGGLVICRDKTKIDIVACKNKLSECLRSDYYALTKEWPYKFVRRRIIAEQYIEPETEDHDLADYKFFCFNGEPKYCQVISGRKTGMSIDFFDKEWNHMSFHEPKDYPFAVQLPKKPEKYDIIWELARKLAIGKAFSRIDFYNVGTKIYFGEITFYPTSGMGGFEPEEWDKRFGDLISLPY